MAQLEKPRERYSIAGGERREVQSAEEGGGYIDIIRICEIMVKVESNV